MKKNVERLIGGLIVSCQAYENTPSYGSDYMRMFARCALEGGAVGIRACWRDNISAIRQLGDFPIIGINKEFDGNGEPDVSVPQVFITPSYESAREAILAGADIIALDCNSYPFRPFHELCALLQRIREDFPDVAIMADLITAEEGIRLAETGLADILSTTLSGLNPEKKNDDPDYEMIRRLKAATSLPVNAEGGIWEPAQYEKCLEAGADMVTIGTAITRPHLITARFVQCHKAWKQSDR